MPTEIERRLVVIVTEKPKKELGIRERRRIYEDGVYVISQAQKLEDSVSATGMERTMRTTVKKQLDRCFKMMATVLGYHELITTNKNGEREIILVPVDNDPTKSITKEQFEKIMRQLPGDKDLREALWNMAVQRKDINIDDWVA